MKYFFTTIIALFLSAVTAFSQFAVRIELRSMPPNTPSNATLYIAGAFNVWNPQDERYRFKMEEGKYIVDLSLPPGIVEFKITRGGWDKVECQKNGKSIGNRQINVDRATTYEINVEGWQDQFVAVPRKSTASRQVHIADSVFAIPQLNRIRRVWVYLPEGYENNTATRWPVLYMHDGQNLFDDLTSFSGEWGVDEFLDSTMRGKCIVVGIDNGGKKRLNEYCPYDFALSTMGFGPVDSVTRGEGNLYVDFLVKTLKPYIDQHYRTLPGKTNTYIAGSSMGGLISMYAVLKYPKVFGTAGVFSPSFWIAPKIYDDIRSKGKKVDSKMYFYAGTDEAPVMVPDMQKAYDELSKVSRSKMTIVIRDGGKHNEARWRVEFPLFYEWSVK